MTRPVSSLRNLGPASERAFARAGIHDAETLQALGADAAYARLLAAGERPHFMGYLALAMGLMGRSLSDCHGAEKAAMRARFDTLARTGRARPAGIERLLDEIGVRPAADPATGD